MKTITQLAFLAMINLTSYLANAQTCIVNENFEFATFPNQIVPSPDVTNQGVVDVANIANGSSQFCVRMGKSADGAFATNRLDIYLPQNINLNKQYDLYFDIFSFEEETNPQDGIYFSNDSGATFTPLPVFSFKAQLWVQQRWGTFPPVKINELAALAGVPLTNKFVIRFVQFDNADFGFNGDEDGIYLDNIKICERNIAYHTVTANTPFFDDFETGVFKNNWRWEFATLTAALPETTEKIDNVAGVFNNPGNSSQFGVFMGKTQEGNGFNATALDLYLNLSQVTEADLNFEIRSFYEETHVYDGIYFSDNGGESFTKVFDFLPDEGSPSTTWTQDIWGRFPAISIDKLAAKYGLSLTSTFVIRFQQYDDADFSYNGDEDNFYIDDVKVSKRNVVYATPPFSDGFETGVLSNNWRREFADSTAKPTPRPTRTNNLAFVDVNIGRAGSQYAVRMGQFGENIGFLTNALDLHVNFSGVTNAALSFYLFDFFNEDHIQDGVYFSDDAGATFKKVYSFNYAGLIDNQWSPKITLDVDQLAADSGLVLSNNFVIRFQQHDDADFSFNGDEDGIYLDDVSIDSVAFCTAPSTPATITGANTVCIGNSNVNFTATQVNGATGYIWTLPNGWSGSSTTNSIDVNIGNNAITGNITVAAVNACDTGVAQTKLVTVGTPSVPSVSISSNDLTACAGEAIVFNATAVNGGNNPGYQWKVNGNNAGFNNSSFTSTTLNNNDEVSVVLTSTQICASPTTALSNNLNVTINPLPQPTISQNGQVLSVTQSFVSYQWLLNNGIIQGAIFNTYTTTQSGNYTVRVTDAQGCSNVSNTLNILISGIADKEVSTISLHPNPASTLLHISVEEVTPQTIAIYNLSGQKLSEQTFSPQIDISQLTAGVYVVELKTEGAIGRKRFVKM